MGKANHPPPIPQHRADWIRLQRLAQYGGVWLDMTVVCGEPLDHWWLREADDDGPPYDLH